MHTRMQLLHLLRFSREPVAIAVRFYHLCLVHNRLAARDGDPLPLLSLPFEAPRGTLRFSPLTSRRTANRFKNQTAHLRNLLYPRVSGRTIPSYSVLFELQLQVYRKDNGIMLGYKQMLICAGYAE